MKNEGLVFWNNPFGLLRRVTTDMEHFLDASALGRRFAGDFRPMLESNWMPSVDVFEKDGHFVVRADLPGLTKNDVNVEVTADTITINGERKKEFEEEKDGVYRHERAYGSFYRAFPLPEGVKPEDVKATFANGVLEVSVPLPPVKAAAPTSRHVEVQEVPGEKNVKAA